MKEYLSEKEYYELQFYRLIPLDYKIDIGLFKNEIEQFPFYQWGDVHLEYPRYACPLVNMNGLFNEEEISCYPLDRYNFLLEYPEFKNCDWTPEHLYAWKKWWSDKKDMNELINETHFKCHTKALDISSLNVINDLKKFMLRSSIFKWNYLGHFKKHIDSWHPTKWIRLWGTTEPESMVLRYEENGKMIEEKNIEAGRLYLHDSLIPHEALSFRDNVYQFFICLQLESFDLIKSKIIK